MAHPMNPILINLSLVPFLSECLPKYTSKNVIKLFNPVPKPISKIEISFFDLWA